MRILISTILLLSFFLGLRATNVDSLKQALKVHSRVDEKIQTLFQIWDYYSIDKVYNPDSLVLYSEQMLELIENTSNLSNRYKAQYKHALSMKMTVKDSSSIFSTLRKCKDDFLRLGTHYYVSEVLYQTAKLYYSNFSALELAESHLQEALEFIKMVQGDRGSEITIKCYSLLSMIQQNDGKYKEALENALKTKELLAQYPSATNQIQTYLTLGRIYKRLAGGNTHYGTKRERKSYRNLAKDYLEKTYHAACSYENYNILALSAFELGWFYAEEDIFEQSNYYGQEALRIAQKFKLDYITSRSLTLLGLNYSAQGKVEEAESMLYKCYEMTYQSTSDYQKIRASNNLGRFYYYNGEYKLALQYINKALKLASKTKDRTRVRLAFFNLYQIYKELGQAKKALLYHEKFIALRDSLSGDKVMREIESLRAQYETAEKERKIAQLTSEKKDQQLNFQRLVGGAIIVLLLIGIASIILFFKNRQKILQAKQESIDLEQRLMRSQMNPHFTFNALGAIQSHLLTGDAHQGAIYLTKFAKLMRQILSQSQKAMISLQEEIDTINNYLSLQKLRYENQFDFQVNVDPNLDTNSVMIPPMLLQPILENSIEHGKIYRQSDGKVDVQITNKANLLVIDILDNGIGRRNTLYKPSNQEHESVALKIIKQRLSRLKTKYGKEVGFKILDPDQGGTEVIFNLPLVEVS